MNKTKAILTSLALSVSVAAVALAAWTNKPMDPFFEANLEALVQQEDPYLDNTLMHIWFVEEKDEGTAIVCTMGGDKPCK